MSAAYQQQLARICGKGETLREAKALLNVARSKTGPGSGHDLGKNTIALPCICAFLASERLGNNDVVKKVAQDVSCLKPKDFEIALGTVRAALANYLNRKKNGKGVSYQVLSRTDPEASLEIPSTPAKRHTRQRDYTDQNTPSPRKPGRDLSSIAHPSTPTRRNARRHPSRATITDVEMEDIMEGASEDISESSEDATVEPRPCRHHQPVLADRLFYQYRDPRILRVWEACETNMKTLEI